MSLQFFLYSADLIWPGPPGFHLLGLNCGLQTWPPSRIYHMIPVLLGAHWQLLPAFHKKNTGIADFSRASLTQPETALKVLLVTLAVSEARAGGFGSADAAAIQASVHFRLVKAKHLAMNQRRFG